MVLSHHSYVYVSDDWSSLLEFLQLKFTDLLSNNFNHPDLWIRRYTTFNIEDSREFKKFHQSKALGGTKIALVLVAAMTTEAQQALLKVIEEPNSDTLIFLIVPHINLLLPTILSRVEVLELSSDKGNVLSLNAEAVHFLQLSVVERLLLIEDWRQKDGEENRLWAQSLLKGIELYLKDKSVKNGLLAVLQIKKYILDSSFSFRLAFLYLALALPEKVS